MTEDLTNEEGIRGSAGRQYELCPGSYNLQKGLPDINTKESEQGNRLHDYSHHPEYERRLLSPEEQDLLRIADELEAQALDAIGPLGGLARVIREEKLVYYNPDGSGVLVTGHPDLMLIYDGTSIVLDRKFGWALVERADVNLQMRCYAVLAPNPEVYVGILQPRAPYADRITIAKYNLENKISARLQLMALKERCDDPDAPLVPGEEQCRYCRARMICPALAAAIGKGLMVIEDLPMKVSKRKMTALIEAKLAKASDEQLEALYKACALAKIVNDTLNDEIRRRIGAGGMTNYKLGNEYDVRAITDVPKAVSLVVLSRLLSRPQVMEQCELSLGKLTSKYRQVSGVSEKEAKADINKALESVLEKEPRKGRILPK